MTVIKCKWSIKESNNNNNNNNQNNRQYDNDWLRERTNQNLVSVKTSNGVLYITYFLLI